MKTMNSEAPAEAYVWTWLAGATEPVVAGASSKEATWFLSDMAGATWIARMRSPFIYPSSR